MKKTIIIILSLFVLCFFFYFDHQETIVFEVSKNQQFELKPWYGEDTHSLWVKLKGEIDQSAKIYFGGQDYILNLKPGIIDTTLVTRDWYNAPFSFTYIPNGVKKGYLTAYYSFYKY